MSPQRVSDALDRWRAAEETCCELQAGTTEYDLAQTAIHGARTAYLDAYRTVVMERGLDGIDRMVADAVLADRASGRTAANLRTAMVAAHSAAEGDQRLSQSDQRVSDADQEEADWDVMAMRLDGYGPSADTQARGSLRRLDNAAQRDENADARDATADQRDAIIESLDSAAPIA